MAKAIIYRNENGGVAVFHPAPKAKRSIDQMAPIVVPNGQPYKIVDASEIPTDRTFREAWEIDESLLTDGVGAPENSFTSE